MRPSRVAAAWAAVLGTAGAVAWFDRRADAGDLGFFVTASRTLASDGWAQTYADPAVQAGPLFLAPLGVVAAAAGWLDVSALGLLALLVQVGAAAALLAVATLVARGRAVPRVWLVLGVGAAALALGLPHSAFVDGHPAQLFVPLAWVCAAVFARSGRVVRAGAVVGLSAGLETWGLLGVVALVLAPRWSAGVRGGAVAVGIATLVYLPFALAGEFRMLEYRWTVADGTLASLVLEPGSAFPWELRLVQAGAAVVAGCAVALLLRRTSHAVWAPLAAVILVRLTLDPLGYSWYWLALQVLVLVGAAELLTSEWFAGLRRRASGSRAQVPMEGT